MLFFKEYGNRKQLSNTKNKKKVKTYIYIDIKRKKEKNQICLQEDFNVYIYYNVLN